MNNKSKQHQAELYIRSNAMIDLDAEGLEKLKSVYMIRPSILLKKVMTRGLMVCNAIEIILAAIFTFAQVFGLIMKRNQTGYSKQETTHYPNSINRLYLN